MQAKTRRQVIGGVGKAFGQIQRPNRFIRGTCSCEECMDHEAEMQAFDRDNLPLAALNNPGWDPICFASDDGFGYLLPGLVKLVLANAEDYVDQFLFHAQQPERLAALSPEQAGALTEVLDFLVSHEPAALDSNCAIDDLFRKREKLEERAHGGLKTAQP